MTPSVKVSNFVNLNFCVFHPIWVKLVMGVTWGKEQHRISLKWLRLFFLAFSTDQPNTLHFEVFIKLITMKNKKLAHSKIFVYVGKRVKND